MSNTFEVKTITAKEFSAFSAAEKKLILAKGYTVLEPDTMDAVAPQLDLGDAKVETQFEIKGDSVYANVDIEICGQKFHLRGVKLTEKKNCMTGYDKEAKTFINEDSDVMSLINMVRTHGASKVSELAASTVRFGKSGEQISTTRDPIADMLAAQ